MKHKKYSMSHSVSSASLTVTVDNRLLDCDSMKMKFCVGNRKTSFSSFLSGITTQTLKLKSTKEDKHLRVFVLFRGIMSMHVFSLESGDLNCFVSGDEHTVDIRVNGQSVLKTSCLYCADYANSMQSFIRSPEEVLIKM